MVVTHCQIMEAVPDPQFGSAVHPWVCRASMNEGEIDGAGSLKAIVDAEIAVRINRRDVQLAQTTLL